MRHLLVLLLVLISLGALGFALMTLRDAPEPEDQGAAPSPFQQTATPDDRDPQDISLASTGVAEDPTGPTVVREGIEERGEFANLVFGSALEGTVRDLDGSPVEGARIRLERGASAQDGLALLRELADPTPKPASEIWNAVTSPEGTFRFDQLEPANDYGVTIKSEDFSPATRNMIALRPDAVTTEDFRLRTGIRLFGTVRDTSGAPIADAKLVLTTLIGAQLILTRGEGDADVVTADAEGQYEFNNLPNGQRAVIVSAKEFGSLSANDVQIGGDVQEIERDFVLEPGTFISGRVLSPAKNPIPGAVVRAISYNNSSVSQGTAKSDEKGNFRVESLAEGTYSLIATANDWGSARLNRIEGGQTDIVLEMIEQGTVRGQVLDSRSQEPPASFKVYARQVIPNSTVYGRRMGSTEILRNRPGGYEIRGLDQGTYVVEATSPGYAPTYSESFQVTLGMVTADIVIQISRGGEIAGILLDPSGEPIRGARVVTHDNTFVRHQLMDLLGRNAPRNTANREMITDKNGAFLLSLLTPELYQLEITHPKYTTLTKKDVRVFPDGQRTELGEIRMQAGGTVSGIVYDGTGTPMPNVTVSMQAGQNGRMDNYQARTGAKGQYQINNARPGAYRLHAARANTPGDPFAPILDMTNSRVDIQVGDGQASVHDLYLQ